MLIWSWVRVVFGREEKAVGYPVVRMEGLVLNFYGSDALRLSRLFLQPCQTPEMNGNCIEQILESFT